jgi:hypothetical protein
MATKEPTLKTLAGMLDSKWYDVRTTTGSSGSMITARKKGCPGHRFFIAWDKKQLMKDVHYGEVGPE